MTTSIAKGAYSMRVRNIIVATFMLEIRFMCYINQDRIEPQGNICN